MAMKKQEKVMERDRRTTLFSCNLTEGIYVYLHLGSVYDVKGYAVQVLVKTHCDADVFGI